VFGNIVYSSSDADKLYRAIMASDEERYDQVTNSMIRKGKDHDAIKSAIVTGLKDNDERIIEAAQAKIDRDHEKLEMLISDIVADGFGKEFVVRAIDSAKNKLLDNHTPNKMDSSIPSHNGKGEFVSVYDYSDMKLALDDGDIEFAQSTIDDIFTNKYQKYLSEGKTEKEAKSAARSAIKESISSEYKPLYVGGTEKEKQHTADLLLGLYVDGEPLYDAEDLEKWE